MIVKVVEYVYKGVSMRYDIEGSNAPQKSIYRNAIDYINLCMKKGYKLHSTLNHDNGDGSFYITYLLSK